MFKSFKNYFVSFFSSFIEIISFKFYKFKRTVAILKLCFDTVKLKFLNFVVVSSTLIVNGGNILKCILMLLVKQWTETSQKFLKNYIFLGKLVTEACFKFFFELYTYIYKNIYNKFWY